MRTPAFWQAVRRRKKKLEAGAWAELKTIGADAEVLALLRVEVTGKELTNIMLAKVVEPKLVQMHAQFKGQASAKSNDVYVALVRLLAGTNEERAA